jgi:hypothetical protein
MLRTFHSFVDRKQEIILIQQSAILAPVAITSMIIGLQLDLNCAFLNQQVGAIVRSSLAVQIREFFCQLALKNKVSVFVVVQCLLNAGETAE